MRIDESIYKVVVDAESAHVCSDEGAEGIPAGAAEEAASDAAVPPAMRRKVLGRDGHRCRRCGRKGALQVHHVVWLSRGGRTELGNLIALCAGCHGLVHEELLEVVGRVGRELRFRGLEEVGRVRGMRMALEGVRARAVEPEVAVEREVAAERELRVEDVPAEPTREWWLAHEHLFEWRRDGTLRLKNGRARSG